MTTGPLYWTVTGGSNVVVTQTGTVTAYAAGTFQVLSEYTEGGITKYAPGLTVSISAPSTTKTLSGLTITGPSSLVVGQSVQATATASYSDGSTRAFTNNGPLYSTQETGIATVTQPGTVTGVSAGSMHLRAQYTEGGVTKTATPLSVSVTSSQQQQLSGTVFYVSPSGGFERRDTGQSRADHPARRGAGESANVTADVTISMAAGPIGNGADFRPEHHQEPHAPGAGAVTRS